MLFSLCTLKSAYPISSLTGSGNRFNFEREEPNQMIGFNSVASILYISHIKDIFATTKRYLVGYPWDTRDIHVPFFSGRLCHYIASELRLTFLNGSTSYLEYQDVTSICITSLLR